MHILSLHRYPAKSLRGCTLTSAPVGPQGIAGDREWLLATPEGVMLTARKHPQMLLWQAETDPLSGSLNLSFDDGTRIRAHPGNCTGTAQVSVWRDRFTARCGDDQADEALSRRFGFPVRLFWLGQSTRTLAESGTPLSFADSAPLLLTHTASLDALNRELGETFAMARFRPNIVISGGDAFAEEGWRRIRIGTMTFLQTGPCTRCVLTTLDPHTAAAHPGRQPLAYLAKHRRALFGIHLRALGSGTLAAGDTLTVLD